MSELFERAAKVFFEVCDLEPSERRRRLGDVGRDDPELLTKVEEILAGDAQADSRLLGRAIDLVPHCDLPANDLRDLIDRLASRDKTREHYRIEGEVARGGMGAILGVWDQDLERPLAMKVGVDANVEEIGTTSAGALRRLVEEARITGQLDHPGIVPVHELGLDQQGRLFFTMKLVQGRTLGEIFRLARSAESGWTVPRALTSLSRVCETMSYAHSKGIIHRDLKPSNVMVGNFGEVYVMDWGIAHVQGREDARDLRLRKDDAPEAVERPVRVASPVVTMDGTVLGTPHSMSPEQAAGEHVDERSDVYAVGTMLYELLTGHPPYGDRERSPREVLGRLVAGPPASVRRLAGDAPREVVAICDKAMARNPEARYPHMGELSEDLRAYLEGRVVRAYSAGFGARMRKWVLRNKAISAIVATLALLAGVGVVAKTAQQIGHAGAATSALESQDLLGFARELGRIPKRLRPLLIRSQAARDIALRLQDPADVLTRLVVDLEEGGPLAGQRTVAEALRRTSLHADPWTTRWFLAAIGEVTSTSPPSRETLFLVARLFYERPDLSPKDVVASVGIRDHLRSLSRRSDLEEFDRLLVFTALSGCGSFEDAVWMLEWTRDQEGHSEARRMGLGSTERLLRRQISTSSRPPADVERIPQLILDMCAELDYSESLDGFDIAPLFDLSFAWCLVARALELPSPLAKYWVTRGLPEPADRYLSVWTVVAASGDEEMLRGIDLEKHAANFLGNLTGLFGSQSLADEWLARLLDTTSDTEEKSRFEREFRAGLERGQQESKGLRTAYQLDADTLLGTELSPPARLTPPTVRVASTPGDLAAWNFSSSLETVETSGSTTSVELRFCDREGQNEISYVRFPKFEDSSVVLEFDSAGASMESGFELALEHLAASRGYYPHRGEAHIQVSVDGRFCAALRVSEFLLATGVIPIPADLIPPGRHRIEIRTMEGTTTTYRLYRASIRASG